MNLFYTPLIQQDSALFEEDESMHIIKVLRMKEGDQLQFTDGLGNLYTGVIAHAHYKKMLVNILEKKEQPFNRNYSIHLAIAPTKNMDRLEWLMEKATEMGIDQISPVICHRSERKEIKPERLTKVGISAMKQSLKFRLPMVDKAIAFKDFISQQSNSDLKAIAHCIPTEKTSFIQKIKPANSILIMIGPEGDFTPEEINLAVQNNFIPVSLGDERLRTETAALAAIAGIHAVKSL